MSRVVIAGTKYRPLIEGLLPYLSSTQYNLLCTYIKNKDVFIINAQDVMGKFTYLCEENTDNFEMCVCGVEITHIFRVQNITEPDLNCIIGCVCIKNWVNEHRKPLTGMKPTCKFCGTRHTKEGKIDCKACVPKKEFKKEYLQCAFKRWQEVARSSPTIKLQRYTRLRITWQMIQVLRAWKVITVAPIVRFGKHKHKNLKEIIQQDLEYARWLYREEREIDGSNGLQYLRAYFTSRLG